MKKALAIILILGFLFVDFLFFHDIFKPGEAVSLPQYVTGLMSVLVFILSARMLVENNKSLPSIK